MEDKGVGIYNQRNTNNSSKFSRARESVSSPSVACKQAKFSTSLRITSMLDVSTPSKAAAAAAALQGIDDFNLDDLVLPPSTSPPVLKIEAEAAKDDLDLPKFEIVDKRIEIQGGRASQEVVDDERSVSSEVVKEVVYDLVHQMRLSELDSIAWHIKALESMLETDEATKTEQEVEFQRLDADEETVTREFLQMLEEE